jgi:predicted dehydrogenase
MAEQPIKFGIIGLDHNHVYLHARMLLDAGAVFAGYYSDKPALVAEFAQVHPNVPAAKSMEAILEDRSISIIGGSAMPEERAGISIKAMQHGKDVISDKPAVINLAQLAEIERVRKQTGRIWCLYSNEHHDRRCTVRAGELVAEGAIGRVVQTTGLGPHCVGRHERPKWFFDRSVSGGIIGDIGTHQIEQFLFFTGSTTAEIVLAQTGNFGNPNHPEFEDYGEVSLVGDGGAGWFRVDWYSPEAIKVPGDIRLFILGTEGYIETRKYIDPAGRPGAEHLMLANKDGARFIDVSSVPLTFGKRLLNDVRNRTETAMPQARSFLAARLSIQAQTTARRLKGNVRPPLQGGA